MNNTLTFNAAKPVTERIKTFADALLELGDRHECSRAFMAWIDAKGNDGCDDVTAYLKLRVICAALNEGWEPDADSTLWHPTFTDYADVEHGCAGRECAESVPCENHNFETSIRLALKKQGACLVLRLAIC